MLGSVTANHQDSCICQCLFFKVNLVRPGGSVWLVSPLDEKSVVLLPKEAVSIVAEDAELP